MTWQSFRADATGGDPFIPTEGAASVSRKAAASQPMAASAQNTQSFGKDTSYITVVDQQGNAVSLTPAIFRIPHDPRNRRIGTRMNQFYLDETHPNGLMRGKGPHRQTGMVLRTANSSCPLERLVAVSTRPSFKFS